MTADQIVLLIYAILLEAGGAMGYIKAGSKASVIASTIFALIIWSDSVANLAATSPRQQMPAITTK